MTREEFFGALAAIVITVLFRLVDRWLPPSPALASASPGRPTPVVSEDEPAAPIEGHPPETPSPDGDLPAPSEDDVEPTHIAEWDLPPPSS